MKTLRIIIIISSPDPKAHCRVYKIGRPLSSVCMYVCMYVNIFKPLLLRNHYANQNQISCGTSRERENESLFKWSRSHDQDGRHAHIWKNFKNLLLRNRKVDDIETWYAALGARVLPK